MNYMPRWMDSLYNLVSGMGGPKDKSTYARYVYDPLSQAQLDDAYRGNWIARKVVNIPAQDAMREWRAWQAEGDQIEALEEEERRLQLPQKIKRALIMARLYGGAALVLGAKAGQPDQELDIEAVGKGGLEYVHVVPRYELSITDTERDLTSPYYGEPLYYERSNERGTLRIHPSRVIRFVGNEVPSSTGTEKCWGDSVLDAVDHAIKCAGMVHGSVASLIDELKVDIVKIPNFNSIVATQVGQDRLNARFSYANVAKSNVNTLMMDTLEEWERTQLQLAGMTDLMREYVILASGAADIPTTRLLGQSPAGMNSTGESDIRNYYDHLASVQRNDITPRLNPLDEIVIRSALGSRDPDIYYEWNPLWQMTDAEKAEIAHKKAQSFQIDVNSGLIPDAVLAEARVNQLIEDGTYPGIETLMEEVEFEAFLGTPEEQRKMELETHKAELAPPMAQAQKLLTGPKKKTADSMLARWRDHTARMNGRR